MLCIKDIELHSPSTLQSENRGSKFFRLLLLEILGTTTGSVISPSLFDNHVITSDDSV